MTQKGLIQTIVLVIVITTVVLVVYFLRSLYEKNTADFGTWSDFNTTICNNEAQGCAVEGSSYKYRSCTPNPRTGFGCIGSTGKHTFRDEVEKVSCNPPCYSAVWSEQDITDCEVYDDQAHTTLSGNQSCRDPPNFTFKKKFKTCVEYDTSGPAACIRIDGSAALLGETEEFYEPCDTIADCYLGTWAPCPDPYSVLSEYCGGDTSQCGEVIPTTSASTCLINDIPVASTNCYPVDDPGPCPRACFNYPCNGPTWPAGFTNIDPQLGYFIEIFSGTDGLVPDWQYVVIACDPAPIATNIGVADIVITTPAPHTIPVGEFISITGVAAAVNGIPAASINGLRQVIGATGTTITITTDTNATSTGVGGGSSVQLEQDPEAAALAQQDVLNTYGPQPLIFAPSSNGERIRVRIIPSQAEVPAGAFYLIAHLPYSGQTGILSWDGLNLVISNVPLLLLGQTFDDVVPRPDLFTFSEPSEPQILNLYTLPGPVLTDLFCSGIGCLTFSTCDYTIYDLLETCV
jgi:hypothetical protein